MSTFTDDIMAEADGEPIEAVVIGQAPWGGYSEDRIERKAPARRNEVLSWEEARPMLDYDFDRGFGAPECDAIYAWTPTRVIFVREYDGSTGLDSLPRYPDAATEPTMA
jgi:hypothetical protein